MPWRRCLEEAWAAYRRGSIPIGAAVADGRGRVVSGGRSRVFENSAERPFLFGHRLAHAEVNALVGLDHARTDPRECVIYSTTEPCPLCTGAIRVSKLRGVRYAARDPVGGSIGLLGATDYMRRYVVEVVGPERADLEAVVAALHVEFSLRTGLAGGERLVARWEADLPRAARLGRTLGESGELRRLGEDGAPTDQVVRRLGELLDPAVR